MNSPELGKKDNAAFEKVMDAFKLEKETDEQKAVRLQKIDEATFEAGYIPSLVVKKSQELLNLIKIAAEKGNQNSLSMQVLLFLYAKPPRRVLT